MTSSPQRSPEGQGIAIAQPPEISTRGILLVEGDLGIRATSLAALHRHHYKVDVCDDGETAWEILLSKNYDLLITSQNLPRLSGLALIRQLRLAEKNLPIILTEEGIVSEKVSRNPWHQIAAILPRPFNDEQLLNLVRDTLDEAARKNDAQRLRAKGQ